MNTENLDSSLDTNSPESAPTHPNDLPVLREGNGRWVKGRSANPSGKRKGNVSIRTERMKVLMQHALADRLPEYLAALDYLRDNDPKAFAAEYRFLLEFFVPKPQRIEQTTLHVDAKEVQVIKIADQTFEIR
jgi:hypothetical protein